MQVKLAIRSALLCIGITIAHGVNSTAVAADVDDCVLNGLKGVTSDAAARMVRQACENKIKSQRRNELASKYGEQVNVEMNVINFSWSNNLRYGTADAIVTAINPTSQTATLIELVIANPNESGKCSSSSRKMVFLYGAKVKPYQLVKLVAHDVLKVANSKNEVCAVASVIRAREPKVLDISIGEQQILSQEEIDRMNFDLGERYVRFADYPVSPAPAPASPGSKSNHQSDVMTIDLKKLLEIAPKAPAK